MCNGGKFLITRAFVSLISAVCVLALFSGCSQKLSEEDVIRRMIKNAAQSAEAKDIEGITSHVSRDFTDDRGNDYKSMRALLFYEFMRSDKVGVVVRDLDVKVKKDEALVDARLLLFKGKDIKTVGDIVPEGAKGLRVNLVLRREEGRWKALSAKWGDVGALGLI